MTDRWTHDAGTSCDGGVAVNNGAWTWEAYFTATAAGYIRGQTLGGKGGENSNPLATTFIEVVDILQRLSALVSKYSFPVRNKAHRLVQLFLPIHPDHYNWYSEPVDLREFFSSIDPFRSGAEAETH